MSGLSIHPSRHGEPAASFDGKHIHSAYNPVREAKRFLDASDLPERESATVVILGAGLGYLDECLRQSRPGLRILALHFHRELFQNRQVKDHPQTFRWHPGASTTLEQFFSTHIQENHVRGLRVLSWPASADAWASRTAASEKVLAKIIRLHSGNISAEHAFGRLWIRNSFRNFLNLKTMAVPFRVGKPVVLAASGPGLEDALPFIGRHRSRMSLWALPSSAAALDRSRIVPDLYVSTDPGFWARYHYRHFNSEVARLMPLSAAPFPDTEAPVLLISQNTPGEKHLIPPSCPVLKLPQAGTVAATAVEAWKQLADGPLILAGLDLSWKDLRAHCRPHSFDSWLDSQSQRRHPLLTEQWERAAAVPNRRGIYRTGPALKTYTDWFASQKGSGIYRFLPKGCTPPPSDFPGISSVDEAFFHENVPENQHPNIRFSTFQPNRKERRKVIRTLLKHWQSLFQKADWPENAQAMELAYALDPGSIMSMEDEKAGNGPAMKNCTAAIQAALESWERTYG